MIVMINKIYNTEMLTHGEHWTNSDFAFIYFGVDFRIGVFLIVVGDVFLMIFMIF